MWSPDDVAGDDSFIAYATVVNSGGGATSNEVSGVSLSGVTIGN